MEAFIFFFYPSNAVHFGETGVTVDLRENSKKMKKEPLYNETAL